MRHVKSRAGPFAERPYYDLAEIDRMCAEELYAADLYPSKPAPIRIERFIEKRFRVTPEYQDLGPGVLGFTCFGPKGVEAIIVSRALVDSGRLAAERRANTTLAHEAGHGLFHGYLFALEWNPSLFGEGVDRTKILCRDGAMVGSSAQRGYDRRWWEYQANRAIGGLFMPRKLVATCLAGMVEDLGIGGQALPKRHRANAEHMLAETFDVNPAAARIRVSDLYPAGGPLQLTL
jgi:hypothetical protein